MSITQNTSETFPDLIPSIERLCKSAEAGSIPARDSLRAFVSTIIRTHHWEWLKQMVDGVAYHLEHSVDPTISTNRDKYFGYYQQLEAVKNASFYGQSLEEIQATLPASLEEVPADKLLRLEEFRAKLLESIDLFGIQYLVLQARTLALDVQRVVKEE